MSTKWTQTLKKRIFTKGPCPFGGERPLRKEHSPKVCVHQNENNKLRSLSFFLQRTIQIIISTNRKFKNQETN